MATYSSICVGDDPYGIEIYNTSSELGIVTTTLGDVIRIAQQRTINSSNSSGVEGEICIDSNYLYVCIAENSWKRMALSAW